MNNNNDRGVMPLSFNLIENNLFDMNLKTLNFDKLSSLPYKLSIKNRLNNRFNSTSICGWGYYNSIFNTELFKKIQYILENSEGKHIDDVFSKISKMIPNNFPYSNHYILERTIRYDEKRTYKWWSAERCTYGTLYIGVDGVIRRTTRKLYKSKSSTTHKKWLREKKQKKIRSKVITDTLLKLLGNKLLFDFYKSLLKDEKTIIQSIRDTERFWKDYNTNTKRIYRHGKDYRRIYLPKRISSDEIKLQQVRNDISKIEEGEYNVFFESNVYLYSLQKECPHFESPIKIENK